MLIILICSIIIIRSIIIYLHDTPR